MNKDLRSSGLLKEQNCGAKKKNSWEQKKN